MSAIPHEDRRPAPPPLAGAETVIEAGEHATPHGAIWAARALYPDLYRHGRVHVAAARAWDAPGLAQLAREPRAARLALEGWAFVDIETTGLGARAGTVAFLVGIGWMERDGFRIEQLLLRDPGDEPALLHAVERRLATFGGIVTYNGKAFDLPVLATRCLLARRPPLDPALVHCDLLHAARRVWAHRFDSCRLVALERRVLGLRREGDVDGRLVPDLYMDYLRRGDGRRLDPVLAHNRADLLSLLLLGSEAARFLARAHGSGVDRAGDPAERAADRLQAARVLLRSGDERRAADLLDGCLAGAAPPPVRMAARTLLAYIRKRQGDLAAACRLWEEQLRDDPTLVEPVEELAKVDEHRRRDPAAALARVQHRLAGAPLDAGSEAALRHRRARLARKLGSPGLGEAAEESPSWGFPGPP
jgi:uncharacterized protein YprB with RNaseH-like and TPR domain